MDGRCKTCKWWDAKGGSDVRAEWGSCRLAGSCGADADYPESKAWADSDESDIFADDSWLNTRSDFGCVQHEPKDSDQ